MKIVHIFAPENGVEKGEGLWAVEYEGEGMNEFDRLVEQGIYYSEDLTNLL